MLSKRELAKKAGLSPITLSRIGTKGTECHGATVEKLAKSLDYPVGFFYGDSPKEIPSESVYFRSLARTPAKEREAARGAGIYGVWLFDWISSKFHLPKPKLPKDLTTKRPEQAAEDLRQEWGMGAQPIAHMIKLLETYGVRVFSLSEETESVDAFSFWDRSNPYIFLNSFKTAERDIFDAAHELGHLVMHQKPDSNRNLEREANRFAAAFLMPSQDVRDRMPRFIAVDTVIKAKKIWRVSAFALTLRLQDLKLLSKNQCTHICINLNKRGYRKSEPNGVAQEYSIIWSKVMHHLWLEKMTKDSIAANLNLPLDEVESLIGRLISPV